MVSKFTDYEKPELQPAYPDTKQVKFESEVLYKNVVILDYTILVGEKGEFLIIKAENADGELISFATSSAVLIKQIKDAKEKGKLPLRAGFDKPKGKRYYTLVAPFK